MKKIYNIFLLAFLTTYPIEATIIQDSIDTRNWESSIDYINTKVTNLYIIGLINKKSLSSIDQKAYYDFAPELQDNDSNNQIPFDRLKQLLSTDFNSTLNNLSTPINDLKKSVKNQNFEELFDKIQGLIVGVKSDVHKGKPFINLKNEFVKSNNSQDANPEKTTDTANVISSPKLIDNNPVPGSSLLLYLSILFFCTSVLFLILFLSTLSKKKKLITSKKRLEDEKIWSETQISKLQSGIEDLKSKIKIAKISYSIPASNSTIHYSSQNESLDKKSQEHKLQINSNNDQVKQVNEYLYAGKPTENGILKDVAPEPHDKSTIFKLSILSNKREEADFEVLLVGDFMTRSITNSPDDYLYRVCNNENSNREFTKEIITVKKGRAEFLDGNWTVKEENKATIKFQ